jgi:hypothetical protein
MRGLQQRLSRDGQLNHAVDARLPGGAAGIHAESHNPDRTVIVKGMIVAAKSMTLTIIDLLRRPHRYSINFTLDGC